jgi:hypothetical protein
LSDRSEGTLLIEKQEFVRLGYVVDDFEEVLLDVCIASVEPENGFPFKH